MDVIVLEPLIHDLKLLETMGISIENTNINDGKKNILKGSLVHVAFDNLGGNTIFGFVKSFNSHYYCRICFCKRESCQKKTREISDKIRTKQHYDEQIKVINSLLDKNFKVEPTKTFGILNYSILNDLNFFKTIENRSQDVMHDVYEGAIPFLLGKFFRYLITHGISTETEIVEKSIV